jgi:toxin ParE1/3/4
VAAIRLSRGAEADLLNIADHTLRTWGQDQAIRYIDELQACCEMLAGNPALGRTSDHVHPGLRRMECGRHVVFYRQKTEGIWVSRILHQSMLPEKRAMEDEDKAR